MNIKSFSCVSGFCRPIALNPAQVCAAVAKGIQHNPAKQGLCPVIPVHTVLFAEACPAVLSPPPLLIVHKTNVSFHLLHQGRSPSVGGSSKTQPLEILKSEGRKRAWQRIYLGSEGCQRSALAYFKMFIIT